MCVCVAAPPALIRLYHKSYSVLVVSRRSRAGGQHALPLRSGCAAAALLLLRCWCALLVCARWAARGAAAAVPPPPPPSEPSSPRLSSSPRPLVFVFVLRFRLCPSPCGSISLGGLSAPHLSSSSCARAVARAKHLSRGEMSHTPCALWYMLCPRFYQHNAIAAQPLRGSSSRPLSACLL